jgi:hypothetical protein
LSRWGENQGTDTRLPTGEAVFWSASEYDTDFHRDIKTDESLIPCGLEHDQALVFTHTLSRRAKKRALLESVWVILG